MCYLYPFLMDSCLLIGSFLGFAEDCQFFALGMGRRVVALESVLFDSQNKKSYKFNDLVCCQRVTCSF